LDDRWGLARALDALGWIAEHLGDYAWAEELCNRSLAIRRELGDQRGMADAMLNLGIIAWVQGNLDEADSFLRESVGIYRALDDWNRLARTLKHMGEVLVRRGLFEDGLVIMESSLEIFEDLGSHWDASDLVAFLAEAHVHLGHYARAQAGAEQGISLSEESKHLWGVGFSQFVQGLAMLAQGQYDLALTTLQAATEAFARVRHRENRGWGLGPLGLAAWQAGDLALARRSVVEALEIGMELGALMPVLYSLPVAALLLAEAGAIERAVQVYACATRYPFVANSCWFQDLIAGPMAAAADRLSTESAAAARERGQAQDWRTLAATLPAELQNKGGTKQ
jgi:tetratricopeptide (TPR) repeat protein